MPVASNPLQSYAEERAPSITSNQRNDHPSLIGQNVNEGEEIQPPRSPGHGSATRSRTQGPPATGGGPPSSNGGPSSGHQSATSNAPSRRLAGSNRPPNPPQSGGEPPDGDPSASGDAYVEDRTPSPTLPRQFRRALSDHTDYPAVQRIGDFHFDQKLKPEIIPTWDGNGG